MLGRPRQKEKVHQEEGILKMLVRKAVYQKETPLELVNLRVRILEEGNPKMLVRKADDIKRNLLELVNIKVIVLEVAIHKAI